MPEKYVKRMNFWENLTPLDSSHLEVFLVIFLGIFHFFEFKFEFWIWAGLVPEPDRTGLTGNRSNQIGSHRLGEPCDWYELLSSRSEDANSTDIIRSYVNLQKKDMWTDYGLEPRLLVTGKNWSMHELVVRVCLVDEKVWILVL